MSVAKNHVVQFHNNGEFIGFYNAETGRFVNEYPDAEVYTAAKADSLAKRMSMLIRGISTVSDIGMIGSMRTIYVRGKWASKGQLQ